MIFFIASFLTAWVLALFGFDTVVILAIFELFGKEVTTATYYFLFGVFGALKSVSYVKGGYRRTKTGTSEEKE